MPIIPASFSRDANGVPITYKGLVTTKARSYTGAAGLGAAGASTLFTVTGDVLVAVFATCSEDLASSSGTIEVGISGTTNALIAQTTASNIDNGHVWLDASPAKVESYPTEKILTAGTDIIETIGTADVTDGILTFYCVWIPFSADGTVVAA